MDPSPPNRPGDPQGDPPTDPPGDSSVRYVVAVAVAVVRAGRVLALRRSAARDAGPGLWETVSGRLEEGEDPLEAAAREVREETGLRVRLEPRPLCAYQARRLRAPMVVVVYRARHEAGEVRISDEHDAFAWLDADAFAERSRLAPLAAAVRRALQP